MLDKRIPYLFFQSMITEGVILSAPKSGTTYMSFAHTEEDIDKIIDTVDHVSDEFKGVL